MTHTKRIAGIRERIEELKDDRQRLVAQKRSRTEVEAIVTRQIADAEAAADAQLRRDLRELAAGETVNLLRMNTTNPTTASYGFAQAGPLLTKLLGPEALHAFLTKHLVEEVREGLDRQQAAARLQSIEDELLALEIEEESLIEQSELTEHPVLRRRDARAEIVLGVHE